MTDLTVTKRSTRAAEAIAECRLLATFTEEPGRTTRRYLSPSVAQVHAHLRVRMEALGMAASVDAAGNLRGECIYWGRGLSGVIDPKAHGRELRPEARSESALELERAV